MVPHEVAERTQGQRVVAARGELVHVDALRGVGGRDRRQQRVDDHVDRHHVEERVGAARKVGELALAVGDYERIHHPIAVEPARLGSLEGALDDRRAVDERWYAAVVPGNHLLAHRLRKGVGVVPAAPSGPPHPLDFHAPVYPRPPEALDCRWPVLAVVFRPAAGLVELPLTRVAERLGFDRLDQPDDGLRLLVDVVRTAVLCHVAVRVHRLLGHDALPGAVDVAGRDVSEDGALAAARELQHSQRPHCVGLVGGLERGVE